MFSLSLLLSLSSVLVSGVLAQNSPYSIWAADSAISRGQGNGLNSNGVPDVSYEHGELWWGLRLLFEKTGEQKYFDYILSSAQQIVDEDGNIASTNYDIEDFSQDPVRTGPTFLYLYERTGDERWKIASDTFRKQLNGQPRTEEEQFWHKLIYFNQGWLDGIYMGEIFYANYTRQFDSANTTAWDDIFHQFQLMYDNTLQAPGDENNIGLLYHGYDYSHTAVWASEDRGHSPEIWDRALGWYMMALVDVYGILPASHQAPILTILQDLAPKVRDAADADTGVWWLVMTQPGRDGNYFESSGAAMFVYSLLKGVRLRYIDDADGSIVDAAVKAYDYITANWVEDNGDGTFDWLNTVSVGSLSGNGTFEYYISVNIAINDLKGLAAFLLASLEVEALDA